MAKDHHDNDMTPAEVEDRIWELADKIDICMFTTWNGEKQHSRPLAARPDRDAHAIYFLVDAEGGKNWEIEKFPAVSIAFADNGGHKYAVISGTARLSNDRAKIKDLWTDFDKAWWDDENDPSIRLLTVTPDEGELWDSPNAIVVGAKMLAAAVSGGKPDMGENARVQL